MDRELADLHRGAREERRRLTPDPEPARPPESRPGSDPDAAADLLADAQAAAERGDVDAARAAASVAQALLDPDDEPSDSQAERFLRDDSG